MNDSNSKEKHVAAHRTPAAEYTRQRASPTNREVVVRSEGELDDAPALDGTFVLLLVELVGAPWREDLKLSVLLAEDPRDLAVLHGDELARANNEGVLVAGAKLCLVHLWQTREGNSTKNSRRATLIAIYSSARTS